MGRVQQGTVRFSNTQGVERSTEVEAAFDSGPKDHPENERDYADLIDPISQITSAVDDGLVPRRCLLLNPFAVSKPANIGEVR